ncbi:MAG: MBL fold metallo-hydrolase [Candidatus Diapherotrites archaeon]
MKLKILGAGREVGRSSFLLDFGEKILLDRGVKFHQKEIHYPMPVHTNIKAAIISHAHMDHSGDLPEFFIKSSAITFMTQATFDLSEILWRDTIKISKIEGAQLRYSSDEIKKTERFTFPIPYRKKINVSDHCSMEFFDAGHILGSAITKLWIKNKSLVYTGDFKIDETRLFKGADTRIGKTNYLIIESTYGNREHPRRRKTEKQFIESVQDTLDNGGFALVPAFAVGRSQEIIDILYEYKIEAPIYYDGMGQKAAMVSLKHKELLKDPKFLAKALNSAKWVKGGNRNKIIKKPCIIVTSAGMLEGGPIIWYLKHLYNDPKTKIFLTGYQVEHTNGRRLLDRKEIVLDGEKVKVACQVEKYDFSAHASQGELLELVRKLEPEVVVCVHGDPEVMDVFQEELSALGFKSTAPKNGEELTLKE